MTQSVFVYFNDILPEIAALREKAAGFELAGGSCLQAGR